MLLVVYHNEPIGNLWVLLINLYLPTNPQIHEIHTEQQENLGTDYQLFNIVYTKHFQFLLFVNIFFSYKLH